MKHKHRTKEDNNQVLKASIDVTHQTEHAKKVLKKAISREKDNEHKITFFKNLFNSDNPKKYYEKYVERLKIWYEKEGLVLGKLIVQKVKLEHKISDYQKMLEALFPDKLATGIRIGGILQTAKKNLEETIASTQYQQCEKKLLLLSEALELVNHDIDSLSAKISQHEMARRAESKRTP